MFLLDHFLCSLLILIRRIITTIVPISCGVSRTSPGLGALLKFHLITDNSLYVFCYAKEEPLRNYHAKYLYLFGCIKPSNKVHFLVAIFICCLYGRTLEHHFTLKLKKILENAWSYIRDNLLLSYSKFILTVKGQMKNNK